LSVKLKIFFVCALVVFLATTGFAYVSSSTNFKLSTDTTDQGGGKASSANFTIQPGAAGQSGPAGTAIAKDYQLGGGYIYSVSSAPSSPGSLAQYRENGVTPIPWPAGYTTTSREVFKMLISDPDPGDVLTAQVELRISGEAFTGVPSYEATYDYTGTPLTAAVTSAALADLTSYVWQARVKDQENHYSDWVVMGGTPDFKVDLGHSGLQVSIIAPDGGERLSGLGTAYNIRWEASDPAGLLSDPITLSYSTDSGTSWTLIAAAQPNLPPYVWTVPAVNSVNCRVSIEAEGYDSRKAADMSAGDFTIDSTRPAIISITPTSGATSIAVTTEVTIDFSEEMSREAVQAAFDLSASPGVAGTFNWSVDGRSCRFKPSAALSNSKTYNVAVGAGASDLAGNGLEAAFSSSFATEAPRDLVNPNILIQRIDAGGKPNTLKSGDYVNRRPRIKGVITDDVAVDRNSIKLYLDGAQVTPVITEINAGNYEAVYMTIADLEDESVKTHSIKLEARDAAGNPGEKEVSELKVSGGPARVIGPVLSYPQTFKPKSGIPARFAYNLTVDSDLTIYLFDTSGQNAWTGKYLSGTEGGKAGYNEVSFYGISELAQAYLGNGVYLYKLVTGGKIIGTGYITIFD
jgi:hypothetical protein